MSSSINSEHVRLIACSFHDPVAEIGPPIATIYSGGGGYNPTRKHWNNTATGRASNLTMSFETAFSEVGNVDWMPQPYNCVVPVQLPSNQYAVAIYGVVSPAFVLMTLITNCLVCVVLMKPQMRNCTNVLLVAMAISDTLTGVRQCTFQYSIYAPCSRGAEQQ